MLPDVNICTRSYLWWTRWCYRCGILHGKPFRTCTCPRRARKSWGCAGRSGTRRRCAGTCRRRRCLTLRLRSSCCPPDTVCVPPGQLSRWHTSTFPTTHRCSSASPRCPHWNINGPLSKEIRNNHWYICKSWILDAMGLCGWKWKEWIHWKYVYSFIARSFIETGRALVVFFTGTSCIAFTSQSSFRWHSDS